MLLFDDSIKDKLINLVSLAKNERDIEKVENDLMVQYDIGYLKASIKKESENRSITDLNRCECTAIIKDVKNNDEIVISGEEESVYIFKLLEAFYNEKEFLTNKNAIFNFISKLINDLESKEKEKSENEIVEEEEDQSELSENIKNEIEELE